MKPARFIHPWKSLHFKISIMMVLTTIILVGLLIVNNLYAIRVVRNQVALSNLSMVSLYMSQIDNGLRDVDQYLWSVQVSDGNLKIIENARSSDEVLMAKVHLQETLTTTLLINKYIDSYFIYSTRTHELTDVFKVGSRFSDRLDIRSYITSYLSESLADGRTALPSTWILQKVGDNYYLFRYLYSGTTVIGAWIDMKTLQIPLSSMEFNANGKVFFTTQAGSPMSAAFDPAPSGIDLTRIESGYYISGSPEKYLVVGKPSRVGNFNLVAVIPDDKILEDLPSWIQFAAWIFLGFFVLLPGFFVILQRLVLAPLARMTHAMSEFGQGNVGFRITGRSASEEFHVLNETFNRMANQIEQLKINVYEEQLDKQKLELQHLQLQINPHFFMNSLNIIHSFAESRKYQPIQELVLSLVRYFRYMFRSNLTLIPLGDELEHVQNYLKIQNIRYPDTLHCEICVPKSLLDIRIPPLLIHTFVENTIIHAVSAAALVELYIEVALDESPAEPLLVLTIRDSGHGFSEDILAELRSGNRIVDHEREHIGIWNAVHRMRLIYGPQAGIDFCNAEPQGAIVRIRLPLLLAEDEENESLNR